MLSLSPMSGDAVVNPYLFWFQTPIKIQQLAVN